MNKKLEDIQKELKAKEAEKATEKQTADMAATSELTAGISNDYAQEERQKLEDYQEAFNAIKDATGVDDVNEVIQKFLTQEDTQNKLQKGMKENQATIERLEDEKRKIRTQVEELKFSTGGAANRRQAIDDFEKHLAEATEKFERNRGKYERLAKMLIDMKAGIDHLAEKLVSIKLENETPLEMSDETVEEVLQQCELKLTRLLSLTNGRDDDPSDRSRMLDLERYEEKLIMRSQSDARVKLEGKDDDGDDDDDGFEEEMDDDVSNRNQVKYNSKQILEKQKTKNRRKGK